MNEQEPQKIIDSGDIPGFNTDRQGEKIPVVPGENVKLPSRVIHKVPIEEATPQMLAAHGMYKDEAGQWKSSKQEMVQALHDELLPAVTRTRQEQLGEAALAAANPNLITSADVPHFPGTDPEDTVDSPYPLITSDQVPKLPQGPEHQ